MHVTHARSFDLQCSEAISAYARIAKLTLVFLLFYKAISAYARLAKPILMRTLICVTPDRHVVPIIIENLPGGAH